MSSFTYDFATDIQPVGQAAPDEAKNRTHQIETQKTVDGFATDIAATAVSAAAAEAARVLAETARDAATVNADAYADEPTGRAAVADGVQFQVISGKEIIRYERVDAGSSTEVARYPSAEAVFKPVATGKNIGWPDTFFKHVTPGVDFMGRSRWFNDAAAEFTIVAGSVFEGKALQTSDNASELAGARIWLDELGAEVGDTVVIYALFTGSGSTAHMPGFQINNAGATVGSQVNPVAIDDVSSNVVTSATPQWLKLTFTIASGATAIRIAPYRGGAAGTINVEALWDGKGTETPDWPVFATDAYAIAQSIISIPELETRADVLDAMRNHVGDTSESISATSKTDALAVTSPLLDQTYGSTFEGWGERCTPDGISFNAFRIKQLGRNEANVPVANQWEEIHVVVRTGATPYASGSTLVAIGSAKVNPGTLILEDLEILLRDPISNAVKTLTDADFSGGKYFIGAYARRKDGSSAYMSPPRADLSNTDSQSYYITSADPKEGDWTAFGTNWRVGFDHVLMVDPVVNTDFVSNTGFRSEVLGDLDGLLDYGFYVAEKVTSSAESAVLTPSGPGVGDRDLPFSGWAETYAAAAVSFNAVRVPSITRADAATGLWSTLRLVVRTGADPAIADAAIIATGQIKVPPAQQTLKDVTIILRDPVTQAVKTLTDADYTGGKYLIGIYAEQADGSDAAMSEFLGTLANGETSYYITGLDPLTAAWSAFSGNPRCGVQHLLLTDPEQVADFEPSNELSADVLGEISAANMPSWAPPKFYILEDLEVGIYFDNLIAGDYEDFHWACKNYARGIQQNERWMFDLSAANIVDGPGADIEIYTKTSDDPVVTKTIAIEAALASAGNGTTVDAIYIGDSLTNAGVITQTLLDLAGADVMGLNLIGTNGTSPNLHEGMSGWTIDDFTSDTVGNPFWIGGQIDFAQYLTDESFSAPDWAFIQLGTNDAFGITSDISLNSLAATEFTKLDNLIASIKAADAGTKVGLVTIPPTSKDQDSFGDNYGVSQQQWRTMRNYVLWNKALVEEYKDREGDRIFIVPAGVNWDNENNASLAASAPANSRSAINIQRQDNGVHPPTAGYQQLADIVWSFLKNQA